MDTKTPYKLGLCQCGNVNYPIYISTPKSGLKNEFPGTYYVHDAAPFLVKLSLDTSRRTVASLDCSTDGVSPLNDIHPVDVFETNELLPNSDRQVPADGTQNTSSTICGTSQNDLGPLETIDVSSYKRLIPISSRNVANNIFNGAVNEAMFQTSTHPPQIDPPSEAMPMEIHITSRENNSSTYKNVVTPPASLGVNNQTNVMKQKKRTAPNPPVSPPVSSTTIPPAPPPPSPFPPPAPPPQPETSFLPSNKAGIAGMPKATAGHSADLMSLIQGFNINDLKKIPGELGEPKTQKSPEEELKDELKKKLKMRARAMGNDK